MAVSMVVMSGRLEKRPGATPTMFTPSIFAGTTYVYVFRVSPLPPLENIEGVLIWVFLGQAEHRETKMDDIGASRLI
jgi:hypothetical protein